MALIKCSECRTEVSDKAEKCPKCACPIAGIKKEESHIGERKLKCPRCGFEGDAKDFPKAFSGCLGIVLFLLFIIPWIIYYILTRDKVKCPKCGKMF